MLKRLAALILVAFIAATATTVAGTPTASGVQQSGTVTAGHLATWVGKDQVQDGGPVPTSTPPGGSYPQLQYNKGSAFGGLAAQTTAAYAAHNTVENGLSYDPRDLAYGAICAGYNTFAGNGTQTTFSYTIPFTGSSSTDNTNFMVFYEPINGSGTATILTTSQFSVTGVNSGSGGTITLSTPVPSGDVLLVVHDDAPGLIAATTVAATTGGYVSVPDGCTIYGSQTYGTVLAEGAQLIGQGFTPNYGYQAQGIKPYVRVIAPTGFAPNFGFNASGKNQQFYEGFTITSNVPGYNSLGFLQVPVLIGANGSSGAGGGQSPGITAQYVTFNEGIVGFGSPIGGNSGYIFSVLRFNNFTANNAGIYGPLSDAQVFGNDFASNGGYGTYGSSGGWVIGPQQGAPGASSAGRGGYNRFEYNSEGIVIQSGSLYNFDGNQFDGNTYCGMDLNTYWSAINVTGGWFRGNANGGVGGTGSVAAGKDADICFNGGSGSGGFNATNVNFFTNYSEGNTSPLGSANATTPAYVYDFNTLGSNNNDVHFNNGEMHFVSGNNGASVTDIGVFRNGKPTDFSVDVTGQAVQGKNANGKRPFQSRGIPGNSWGAYIVVGGPDSYNNQFGPLTNGYGALVGKQLGVGPNYYVDNSFSVFECDIVNAEIPTLVSPNLDNNALITWLPNSVDVTFGGGSYQNHEIDSNSCRMGGLTWMAVPTSYKEFAQNSTFWTFTGSWTSSSSYGGSYGMVSNTNGDSGVGTIITNGGSIYLWYLMQGNNGGTFTYQLDGGPATIVNTQGQNAFTYPINTSSQTLGAIRVPAPSAATHTITVTVTSATSASNTVTILGIGTSPGTGFAERAPVVVLGGQIPNTTYAAASTAFNNDMINQSTLLFNDGLQVLFADILKKFNATTDITTFTSSTHVNSLGQSHIADAFNEIIQGAWSASNAVNPIDYGAACNTQYLTGNNFYGGGAHALFTTANSNVISIQNYYFQPGVATQTGGGDVGKAISLFGADYGDMGITTYIQSVNTTNNTATIGHTIPVTASSTTENTIVIMGGYPSNPNNPATAQDDTAFIELASKSAAAGGGVVFLPPNCLVHNLILASNTELVGNNGGNEYGTVNTSNTILYVSSTGYPSDVDQNTGIARNVGINMGSSNYVKLKDFTIQGGTFPYMPYGINLACIGTYNNTGLFPENVVLDHVSAGWCPVGMGIPFGNQLPIAFTASISGTTMTVSAITSTNFAAYGGGNDFIAVGRTITGTGVTSGTVVLSAPIGGGAGVYTVSKSQTVASEAMTSAAQSTFVSGSSRFSEFNQNGIGIFTDVSDWAEVGDVFTGNYVAGEIDGPNTGGSTGNAANRILGGRFEENGNIGAFVCSSCAVTQLNDVQFQFNSGNAVTTMGSWNEISVTGGMMQGNGASLPTANNAQIGLGGTGNDFSVNGVEMYQANSGGGPATHYVFNTLSGANVDYVDWEGGNARLGYSITPVNWIGSTPAHYKQNVPGLPLIDTTQSILSINSSGVVGIGTSSSGNSGIAFDMGSTTGAVLLPVGTTGQEPSSPIAGEIRYNSTTHAFEGYQGATPAWSSLGGSAITALTGGVTASGTGSVVATVVTNANLTGPITSVGNATSIASQTGTGSTFVVQTSPSITSPTITGSLTATGLVTNADLANSSTTVNGSTCTLGSTCSITATATSITPGTTTIIGGTNGYVEYNNHGVLGEKLANGTGTVTSITPADSSIAFSANPLITSGTIAVSGFPKATTTSCGMQSYGGL